jgi:phenylalanyl-tRNA synthetase beta chain
VEDPGTQSPSADQDPVILRNPQNAEWNQMRRTFLHSLLKVAALNFDRQTDGVSLFEIANTYTQKTDKPCEEKKLALLQTGLCRLSSWMEPGRLASFHDLKGILFSWLAKSCDRDQIKFMRKEISGLVHSTSLEVRIAQEPIGYLGEVHPDLLKIHNIETPSFYAEIKLAGVAAHLAGIRAFRELPKYPAIRRDLAVIVNESVRAEDLSQAILNEAGRIAVSVELFDLFRGGRIPKGYKNLGFRVTYQSSEKTLLSDEIQLIHSRVAQKIQERFQAAFQ